PRSAQETGSDPAFTILAAEAEREARAAGRDRRVLAAVDGIGHRTRVDLSPERLPPQELARARVEREEVALASAAEYEVARRRQHAGPRDVGHAVLPDRVERIRIVRADHAIGLVLRVEERLEVDLPHRGLPAVHAVRLRELPLDADDGRVLPVRHVVEPGFRAERRRLPVDRAVD